MTKKEFKFAMQCGLGRCIQELKTTDDIEKYRNIVLWGCTHNLSYDAQCEGTRSYYLYQLVKCYPDETPFVKEAILYFNKSISKSGWDFLQSCRFLELFAIDGNLTAFNTLKEKYSHTYNILKNTKRRLSNKILPIRDNFEELCISIVNIAEINNNCENMYCKVVEDLGCLIMENPLFNIWNFSWFQSYFENENGKKFVLKLLKQKAKHSDGIKFYLDALLSDKKNKNYFSERLNKAKTITANEIYETLKNSNMESITKEFPILFTAIMLRNGNIKEVEKLADYYNKETDLIMRNMLLKLLSNKYCTKFLNTETVIQDSKSDNNFLQKNAFHALEYMKDDKIRNYALELLQENKHSENIIYMLANNYKKEDYSIFSSMIKSLPITYHEKVSWHGPYSAVLDMFKTDGVKYPPKELLFYMYEHTLCSCCRDYILTEMSRRKMVNKQILQECLFDSNDDIRKFAEKRLKKLM